MSQTLSAKARLDVLQWADVITPDPHLPADTTATARPLLAWLEAATSEDDLQARLAAMKWHHDNTLEDLLDGSSEYRETPVGDPDRYVAGAAAYHAFMTGSPARAARGPHSARRARTARGCRP